MVKRLPLILVGFLFAPLLTPGQTVIFLPRIFTPLVSRVGLSDESSLILTTDSRVTLTGARAIANDRDVDLIALDEALNRLAQIDPQQSRIVELRFFSGLNAEETAEALGISPATVKRDWRLAKGWLHREIGCR